MLVFYSRFFSLKGRRDLEGINHLIILIDEGETYFHPDWQRKYLGMVVNYLSKLFPDKTVQLIITSNSPFIASDIPRTKINFLKVVDNNCKVLDNDKFTEETFGSNIHSLYTNAFFLDHTLMGEISRRWIDRIIDDLNKRDYVNDQRMRERLRQDIELIGEPIIRNFLLQRLDDQIG